MPDNSQVDDEREPLTDDEIEKLAHPTSGVRRYDRRAVAQSVREQRKREPELRKIDRSNRKMAELLEGRDDLASMRLLFEINERQRDRIMGKPFVSDPPSKSKARGFKTTAYSSPFRSSSCRATPRWSPPRPSNLSQRSPNFQRPNLSLRRRWTGCLSPRSASSRNCGSYRGVYTEPISLERA